MEVQFSASEGNDAAQIVEEPVASTLSRDAEFMAAVEHGIAASKRGDVVSHHEVEARINRLFQS